MKKIKPKLKKTQIIIPPEGINIYIKYINFIKKRRKQNIC